MFFGLDMEKLLLIALVAALLLGPERIPALAEKLAQFTVRAREWIGGAKARVKEEMGDDFDDVEWRKLDPRQYDPRRIIREALLEEPTVTAPQAAAAVAAPAVSAIVTARRPGDTRPVVFDDEAT